MKRTTPIALLCLHALLLLLAATEFTVPTGLWTGRWSWQFFAYSHSNGFGYEYRSNYALHVVLAYIAAHLAGIAGHVMARAHVRVSLWSTIAIILCALGLISFTLEASHWLWAHHRSWIASFPAASLVLAIGVLTQVAGHARLRTHSAGGSATSLDGPIP